MKAPSAFVLLLFLALAACQHKDGDDAPSPGAVLKLRFSHLMEGAPLAFFDTRYRNANGDEFTVEQFKYYISNVKLTCACGSVHAFPDSYHLIEARPGQPYFELSLPGIPAKAYKSIAFSVGIDSARNFSLDNTGDLDPTNNMAWNWNTGYKFVLLEGRYFPPTGNQRGLVFHIGGMEAYRTLEFPLPEGTVLAEGTPKVMGVAVETSGFFQNPHTIDFSVDNTVMFGEPAARVADNYATGVFSLAESQGF